MILSETDKTIKNDPLLQLFMDNVNHLKVVKVATDHYPVDVTRDYFRSRFPEEAIKETIFFFNGGASKNAQLILANFLDSKSKICFTKKLFFNDNFSTR